MKGLITLNRLNYLFTVYIYSSTGEVLYVNKDILTRLDAVNYIVNCGAKLL